LQSKEDKICIDCDMFANALTLPEITLPETANIQFLMNLIVLQNVVTQTFVPSFLFLSRTGFGVGCVAQYYKNTCERLRKKTDIFSLYYELECYIN